MITNEEILNMDFSESSDRLRIAEALIQKSAATIDGFIAGVQLIPSPPMSPSFKLSVIASCVEIQREIRETLLSLFQLHSEYAKRYDTVSDDKPLHYLTIYNDAMDEVIALAAVPYSDDDEFRTRIEKLSNIVDEANRSLLEIFENGV